MAQRVTPQPTPNPNALRFTLAGATVGNQSVSARSEADAAGHPWAAALLALDGVESVFAVNDFVTVTKSADASWDGIVPKATAILAAAELGGG